MQDHYNAALHQQTSAAHDSLAFQMSEVEDSLTAQANHAKKVKFDTIRSRSKELRDNYTKQMRVDFYSQQSKLEELKTRRDAWYTKSD